METSRPQEGDFGVTTLGAIFNMEAEFAADQQEIVDAPPPATLKQITELAAEQKKLEGELALATLALAAAKGALEAISEKALPQAMKSLGMTEFKLEDGSSVTIKTDVKASMRADLKEQCVEWLDKHRLGDIVSDTIVVEFPRVRGEAEKKERDEKIKELQEFLQEKGASYEDKLAINAQTLKATVKDYRRKAANYPGDPEAPGYDPLFADKDFPGDLFVLFDTEESKIVMPKEKKPKK